MATNPFNTKQLNYRSYINTVRSLYEQPVTQASTALILTLLTISFFGIAAIRPTFITVTELESELKEKRTIEAQMHEKLTSLSEVQDTYLENQDLLKVYDRAIPDDSDLENFIVKLEYVFSQSPVILAGTQVENITTYGNYQPPKQADTNEQFASSQITLTVNGSYDNLVAVLERVSNLDRYVEIESITFRETTEEDSSLLSMGVRLKVYWNQAESKL